MASGDAINSSSSSNVLTTVPLHRPLPDTSKIEAFDGKNFRRWQERLYSVLDMHGVVDALEKSKPADDAAQTQRDFWQHANKVCRHTLLSTLSNDIFDIYSIYKEAKKIWESLIRTYTAEDAGKQKFVVGNFYKWEMVDDKDIKQQINDYHRLLEELHAEKITLPDEFVTGILIEKLPESWSAYKQQLKHKQKQLSLSDLITHIIIKDTNRKAIQIAKGKEMTAKANLVESHKRYDSSKNKRKVDYKLNKTNPKKKCNCFKDKITLINFLPILSSSSFIHYLHFHRSPGPSSSPSNPAGDSFSCTKSCPTEVSDELRPLDHGYAFKLRIFFHNFCLGLRCQWPCLFRSGHGWNEAA
ncbi:Retrovirus-related Pol polyprotein from transposon TNT 1-94 [Senna tora]|uniref:Retrovirus-related Pol polyprotein from transposon TNT 1-94 n=1 Tax=Senna tora TaxID=362788 RepID=A0A834W3L4_9FABA|nr:Retrovirus-related Pol polyprotein from transposon TNT 1-94 [Senna tora]